MLKKIKKPLLITLNILVIIFVLWAVICEMTNAFECDNGGWSRGIKAFKFFTNNANVMLMINSIWALYYLFTDKIKAKAYYLLRIMSMASMMLTFIVVYTFLAEQKGFQWICFGFPAYLFVHTLNPLLSFILFFLEEKDSMLEKDTYVSIIPILIYGLIWIIVLLIWHPSREIELDPSIVPYFFLAIHYQPWYETVMYFLGMSGGTYFLSWLLIKFKNKFVK